MHKITRAIIALSVVCALVSVAVVPATASHDDTVMPSVVEDASVVETAKAAGATMKAYGDRLITKLRVDETDWSADATADELQTQVNNDSDDYQRWLNDRLDADEDQDVMEITLDNETSNSSLYLVADAQDGTYENLSAVRDTDRAVDEDCEVSGLAGQNAADELDRFHEEFVVDNQDLSMAYMGQMKGKYRGDVDCSFLD